MTGYNDPAKLAAAQELANSFRSTKGSGSGNVKKHHRPAKQKDESGWERAPPLRDPSMPPPSDRSYINTLVSSPFKSVSGPLVGDSVKDFLLRQDMKAGDKSLPMAAVRSPSAPNEAGFQSGARTKTCPPKPTPPMTPPAKQVEVVSPTKSDDLMSFSPIEAPKNSIVDTFFNLVKKSIAEENNKLEQKPRGKHAQDPQNSPQNQAHSSRQLVAAPPFLKTQMQGKTALHEKSDKPVLRGEAPAFVPKPKPIHKPIVSVDSQTRDEDPFIEASNARKSVFGCGRDGVIPIGLSTGRLFTVTSYRFSNGIFVSYTSNAELWLQSPVQIANDATVTGPYQTKPFAPSPLSNTATINPCARATGTQVTGTRAISTQTRDAEGGKERATKGLKSSVWAN